MSETITIVTQVKDLATSKVDDLTRAIERLGGEAAVANKKLENKLSRELKLINGEADKAKPIWSRFTQGIAVGTIAANVAMKAFGFLKGELASVVSEGMAAEKTWNAVSASLKRHGDAIAANLPLVKEFTSNLQETLGISDELAGEAFIKLHDAGLDVKSALSLVATATDLAAASGTDLVDVASQMAKFISGASNDVRGLNLEIKAGASPMERYVELQREVSEHWGGAAAADMGTMAGKVRGLGESWGELKEKLYETFKPVLVTAINDTTEALKGFMKLIEPKEGALDQFAAQDVALGKVNMQLMNGKISAEEYAAAVGKLSGGLNEGQKITLVEDAISFLDTASTSASHFKGNVDDARKSLSDLTSDAALAKDLIAPTTQAAPTGPTGAELDAQEKLNAAVKKNAEEFAKELRGLKLKNALILATDAEAIQLKLAARLVDIAEESDLSVSQKLSLALVTRQEAELASAALTIEEKEKLDGEANKAKLENEAIFREELETVGREIRSIGATETEQLEAEHQARIQEIVVNSELTTAQRIALIRLENERNEKASADARSKGVISDAQKLYGHTAKLATDVMGKAIDSMFDGGKIMLGDLLKDWAKQLMASAFLKILTSFFSGGALGGLGMFGKILGFDEGTDYVDRDQLALIHKGEAIIPARDNPYTGSNRSKVGRSYAAAGGGGGSNMIIQMNFSGIANEEFIRNTVLPEITRAADLAQTRVMARSRSPIGGPNSEMAGLYNYSPGGGGRGSGGGKEGNSESEALPEYS